MASAETMETSTTMEAAGSGGVLRPMEPIHGSDICITSMRMSSETLTICERAFLFAASKTPNNEEATDHTVCRFSGVEPQRALLFVQNTLKVSELGSVAYAQ